MSGDVCSALAEAKECIESGLYLAAVEFIEQAEKAWAIEVDAWAIVVTAAEKELNGR